LARCADAIDDDADEHEGHPDEDDQVRGQLRAGHASVVVFKSGVQVGNQIGRDSQDHDGEADLRSEGQLMGCLGHSRDDRDS
jgi:hypothetical protein